MVEVWGYPQLKSGIYQDIYVVELGGIEPP